MGDGHRRRAARWSPGIRHGAFGGTDVWGVKWDKCLCPDRLDCFACISALCVSEGSAEGISLPKQRQVRGELELSLGQARSPFAIASRKQRFRKES